MNVIFGASGHAKEIEWLISDAINESVDYFVDKNKSEFSLNQTEIISEDQFLEIDNQRASNLFIGIGNPIIRKRLVEKLISFGYLNDNFKQVIHPSVSYDKRHNKILIGDGTLICSKSVITTDVQIGTHCLINTDCTIAHDSVIGNFVTISPGVHISGNVSIGDECFLGTGAVILEGLRITDRVTIGAGAVVSKNINEPGTYVGIPVKKIK